MELYSGGDLETILEQNHITEQVGHKWALQIRHSGRPLPRYRYNAHETSSYPMLSWRRT
ncbi:hypothetical protein BDW75DRAFT_218489 [Aspergillus navahoensis]